MYPFINKIYYLFFIAIFFIACHKDDDEIIIAPDCLEDYLIPAVEVEDSSIFACFLECSFDCEIIYSSDNPYNYYYPCFNPQNPDQLAYYRKDNKVYNNANELWVVDFCTGERNMLVNDALYGLDWSIKDWLIYTASDQNIWKIKSNGDSLTQITSSGDYNRYPKWDDNGERIAYELEDHGQTFFIVLNTIDNLRDTLWDLRYIDCWSWVGENKIAYAKESYDGTTSHDHLMVYDLSSGEAQIIHEFIIEDNINFYVYNMTFDSENSIVVWSALGTIGKTSLSDGTYEVLKQHLYQERYDWHTFRRGTNEILFNKHSSYYVDYCEMERSYEFLLMNEDGTDVRKLEFEE